MDVRRRTRATRWLCLLLLPALSACDGRGGTEAGPEPAKQVTGRLSTTISTTRPVTPPASAPASQPGGDEAAHARLYGTWVAHDVDVSFGEAKIRLTFRRQGPVRILAWSELPFVGQVRDKQAPYEIHGNTITSDALRGGTSVQYRFDDGKLIIEYTDGKAIRFARE